MMVFYEIDEKLRIEVVEQKEWCEIKPNKYKMVVPDQPFAYIRFAYNDLKRGENPDLIDALKKWDKRIMEAQTLTDVPYNFLISEDKVYEARGWHYDANKPSEFLGPAAKCLDIAYIGDYSNEYPPWEMLYTAHKLILYGMKEKLIWEEVRVIPYNHIKVKEFT